MAVRGHWGATALVLGLALVVAGCGGDDSADDAADDTPAATAEVDDSGDQATAEDESGSETAEDEGTDDDGASAGGGASVPDGADALASFDIDGVGSYELPLTIPSGVCFISDEALTISGDGPSGESASIDYAASLDATSVYLDVPDDGVQVGAGDAAISGADPVDLTVAGDRVSGSGVFVALDGSGEYEGTFEFVCG